MDHDDSDFQSQNFQLAGGNNSKLPSSLQPFALPKLDIDDQLQGHLRFDSLIDSEVFFNIQGHESSWILSSGSSVVDFSSSAAESCSISKTNNIWSEATSTESVEILLKSVGENEMTGNMDGKAQHQLSGMDSQIDPSKVQPKSNNSPTDSTVVPTENNQSQSTRSRMSDNPDHSQSTHSRMTEDPSSTQPQFEHFAPFSVGEKAEQAAGSILSDRNSNFVLESVAEKCIVSEKLSSSNNTSESCPAVGNYFEVVHDDRSLDRLNVPSAEVDSRNLNNEPFPELPPLQNIYVTGSYSFEQDNQESEVGIPQNSKICHMKENKIEGGLHELQNLSCTGQTLGTVSQVSNETLLSENSDGLLESITNQVKVLHRNEEACKRVDGILQPPFPAGQHAAEDLKSSVDMSNEIVSKESGIGPNSASSHQSEPEMRHSNPHLVTSPLTESSKMNQSPQRMLAHSTGVPEETKNAGADNTDIFSGNEPKLVVLEHHQASADYKKSGAREETTIREEMPAVTGNIEDMLENDHEETATGVTGTSNDKFDSSCSIALEKFSVDNTNTSEDPNIPLVNHEGSFKEDGTPALKEEPQNMHLVLSASGPQEKMSASLISSSSDIVSSIPSLNHEGSFKEGDKPALEEEPQNSHVVLPASGPQEKMSAPLVSSSSDIVLTTVTATYGHSEDKKDCSGGVSSDDSSAPLPDEKDLRMSAVNHEGSFKERAEPTLSEDEEHTIISPGSEPEREMSAVSVNSNIDAVSVAKKVEHKGLANFLGGLTTGETQDKSGNYPDSYSQKCQTDGSSIHSEDRIDLVTPSALDMSTDKDVEKIEETPHIARDDAHTQDTVLNHGADHSPGTFPSQGMLGSSLLEPGSGDVTCTDATCGSPSVISCTELSPQECGHGSNALIHQTLDEQPDDLKDSETSGDATRSPEQYSTRNLKSAPGFEETNTAGDDRSFSFEVGAPANVSEKAHSPAWSPFPTYRASQSTEITTEDPQPKSPERSLKNTSDDSKKKSSIVESGKQQLSQRKVTVSAGGPSDNSKIGDSSKTKTPPEQSQQHPIPEGSDLVNLPFTDSQHLQLRAQIFVYGALIQGTPPGEAYMVAAFGEPVDGGKPTWEAAWRSALERFQYQKSLFTYLETPTSSRIGSCVSEKASQGTTVKTAPASKKGGKTVLPAHSAVPMHSPTVNATLGSSTFNLQRGTHLDFGQAVSPLYAYNSHMRHPSPGVASWYHPSPGPRPASWPVPPKNLILDSSMQPAVPTNESAKGAFSKNISISHAISPAVFSPSPAPSIASPSAVVHEKKQKAPTSTSKHATTSQKPRKRKKASANPEQQPVIASPQLRTDMVSFTPVAKHTTGFTLSNHSPSNALGSRLVPNTDQITSLPNYQITGGMDAEQRNIFSEQICGAIEQSIGQAKGASVHSMDAIKHKESIWSHLSTISRNKLPPEIEEKLTSAAAAAEAAVSVAKAAAEAAKMASEAVLHAKLVAEEVISSSKSVNSLQNHEAGEFNVNGNAPSLSSSKRASSRKIKNSNPAPGSIVSVAREVARKRVEEASAAAKRAENLDAILKAAELAAEAVFNAGTIIGMGEPLPFTLSELLEAGPDGYWKSERVRNNKAGNGTENPIIKTLEVDVTADVNKSGRKRGRKPKYDPGLLNAEPSSSGKELQPDGIHSGNGVKDVPTTASVDGKSNGTAPIDIIWNGIEKGSAVEVSSDMGGLGVTWFSAKVVDINEDSALISYDNHSEGTGPHEEWVPLKQEGDKAPQIRLTHPATLSKFKTRKRRRETAGSCSWVIGDHVDAWVKDSWREGIIAQNYEANETKFVIQFSAGGGDPLVVDAWNLRPSLVWEDGQWTEWSRAGERKSRSNKGDSPLEKRRRTGPLQAGGDLPIGGEEGGPSKDMSTNNAKKAEELKPLALNQRDMVFNVGKSVIENKTDALAFKRPGLQKEGSKVVYGVPKHGKKKKFMEVSKHYVAGRADKISEGNASSRFAKHLMPPFPRPRDNTSKFDQRGRVGGIRSRGPKPSKSQNVAANSVSDKDPLLMSVPNAGVSERSLAFVGSMTSTSNTEKPTVENNKAVPGTGLRTEDPSVSEMQSASTIPTSKQSVPTTSRNKRKYVPTVDNRSICKTSERTSSSSAEPQRISSDSAEPRRSNRRIQPTSRLLEGLQSSLIVSKIPGEKFTRSQYRGTFTRGGAHG